jgi:hypothetical protein
MVPCIITMVTIKPHSIRSKACQLRSKAGMHSDKLVVVHRYEPTCTNTEATHSCHCISKNVPKGIRTGPPHMFFITIVPALH